MRKCSSLPVHQPKEKSLRYHQVIDYRHQHQDGTPINPSSSSEQGSVVGASLESTTYWSSYLYALSPRDQGIRPPTIPFHLGLLGGGLLHCRQICDPFQGTISVHHIPTIGKIETQKAAVAAAPTCG